ncbi:MAG: hypothetical protein ACLP8S_14530 [Solirubrobacteraceae bacterium]
MDGARAAAQRELVARSAELVECREGAARVRAELHAERQARAHSDERVRLFKASEALRQAGTHEQEAVPADASPEARQPRSRKTKAAQLIAGSLTGLLGLAVAVAKFEQVSGWWEWVLLIAMICAGAAYVLATFLDWQLRGIATAQLLLTVAAIAALYGDFYAPRATPGATPPAPSARPARAVAQERQARSVCRSACVDAAAFGSPLSLLAPLAVRSGAVRVGFDRDPFSRSRLPAARSGSRSDRGRRPVRSR